MNITTKNPELAERRTGECVSAVLGTKNLRRATAYISPKLVIKASAQRRYRGNEAFVTVLVTVGRPNFAERRFIKVCQRAGMCFPLKQLQLKFWPAK